MQNTKMSTIEQKVMGNVGAIYTARALTGMTALKIYALILSVWAIGRFAWVAKVFANFAAVEKAGVGATAKFALYALEHAHLGVQVALLVGAIAFIALVREAFTLRPHQTQVYQW